MMAASSDFAIISTRLTRLWRIDRRTAPVASVATIAIIEITTSSSTMVKPRRVIFFVDLFMLDPSHSFFVKGERPTQAVVHRLTEAIQIIFAVRPARPYND